MKVKTSVFFRNIFVVMAGTGIAQIISLRLAPVLSRLFTPSDFGIAGSFEAIASIIAAGVTLEYSQAIMLPKEKKDALGVLAVSFVCTVTVSLLALLFCLVTPATINGLMKTKGFWPPALLVLSAFINGLNYSCQAWAVRVKAFRQTSVSQIVRSFSGRAQASASVFSSSELRD